jgi:hypothetical protein
VVASVVTVNDSHDELAGVDLECSDRIYLNEWTAMLARYR